MNLKTGKDADIYQKNPDRYHYSFPAEAEEFGGPVCPATHWIPEEDDEELAMKQAETQIRRDLFRADGDWQQHLPEEAIAEHLAGQRKYRQTL